MKQLIVRKSLAIFLVLLMLFVPVLHPYAQNILVDANVVGNDGVMINENVIETDSLGIDKIKLSNKKVITLITGDVVTITPIEGGKSIISVEPSDKVNGGVQITKIGKETFVIPKEAMPYLASNYLDRDLFNITALIQDGYDDASQSTLPVIVQYDDTKTTLSSALSTTFSGAEQTIVLESVGAVALSTQKKSAKNFWADLTAFASLEGDSSGPIKKVWLDGRVQANLAESVPMIGAPDAWAQQYDGSGVTVAVLDSGLDSQHPDLAEQFDEVVSFVPTEQEGTDYNGHGTHVASTVLGTGAASNGANKGVAPGARLIAGKVLAKDGYGQESWVIAGMEWAANNAKIVNMSLGDPRPSDGQDMLSQSLNEISERTGTLFVVSAGNTGTEGIGSPGAADAALTVGSVTKYDSLSAFSSRGPRFMEDGLKPDLLAPGSSIVAARSQHVSGSGFYLSLSGTSMAAPHVAGAAAILAQRYPEWTGEELKHALMSTTKKIDRIKPYYGGTGRLDVKASTFGSVYATGSLDFGFYDWPHDDDVVVEKTVTYRNESEEQVVLDLSTTFTTDQGVKAPEGLLTLSSNQVTVPANESITVTVTADPNLAVLGNRYQGHLTASINGEKVAHTAMVLNKEAEKHSLTINVTNPDGTPGRTYVTLVGSNFYPEYILVEGTKELRLAPGTYSVMSMMDINMDTDEAGVAILGNPEVKLDGPQTVELDARNINKITANVPDKTKESFRKLEYYRSFGEDFVTGETFILPATQENMYAQATNAVTEGDFQLNTRWRLVKPLLDISVKGQEIESLVLAGSTPFEGKHELEVVYAGKGTTNDYKDLDVNDKAVLVERSDKISGSERAKAAQAAGAKLLIIMNDSPTKFAEWVGKADYETANLIAAVGVSGKVGGELKEAVIGGSLSVNVEGTLNSPYVYDLVDNHQHQIPENLAYSPTEDELVKIDSQYYSDREKAGREWRVDIPSYSESGYGDFLPLSIPTNRIEWVSATENTNWFQVAIMIDEWEVRGKLTDYEPGERLVEKWFAPIARPSIGDGYWVPNRFGSFIQFNVPAWADAGKGHTGTDESGSSQQSMELYLNDTKVSESKGQTIDFNAGLEENAKYRLVVDASRDSNRWNTSVQTHTEWTIWTKEEETYYSVLPMISLEYEVETDMQGNGIGGDTITLGLSTSQIEQASGNGTIEGASLDVSFDEGETWEAVELVQNGDGWLAEISNAAEAGTYVSIRASAWDDLGNKIEQEIIKAFGVSSDTVTLTTDQADYALKTGTTRQMNVTEVTTPKGEGKPTLKDVTTEATYVVEDEKVATVEAGLITAKAKGSTKVTVSYGGKQVVANVSVTDPLNPGPIIPGPVDPEPEKPEVPVFTDITNTFAKDEINKLAAKGIIQGKTETTFAPNAQITRAEFTVLLARALNLPMKEYEGKFKDVHSSKKWAYAGIEAAATAGIVNGTLDGKFNPDAPIKREEIAAMVVRAIAYQDKTKLDNLDTPANFKDHGSIGAYAIDSVYKATALGVIKGNEGKFKPKDNATRAEAAVMLYRALNTLKLMD